MPAGHPERRAGVRPGVPHLPVPDGLRDLARWCLALSDEAAHPGAHVHLDPGIIPLALESMPLMLARDPTSATAGRHQGSASGG
ncbi:Imm32 family immunity protein [Rhizomonospora bruguierae]